ncbi:hypothetical protein [Klebsiella variicola]|uniref:hypothetical protein n=1 Tax=Klebsiella variicola TaxID=244366 RepID=UPI0011EF66EC|nr:hypothetical protein [Klebsiella variicola]KAA0473377.1 hypothetical protein F0331_06245 [Klebsiella variicola]
MSKETGGYAFPIPNADFQTFQPSTIDEYKRIQSGMTLRDYFAAEALGLCYAEYLNYAAESGFAENWRDGVANDAYLMADAMIKAREVV